LVLGIHLPHREKKVEEEDMITPQFANTALSNVSSRGPGDRSDRREKGIDIDMIDPEEVITELRELAHYTTDDVEEVTAVDKEGNIVFEEVPALDALGKAIYKDVPINASGVTLIMKQPLMIKKPMKALQIVQREHVRSWAIAALIYFNKVWPTIWMPTEEAITEALVFRTAFYKIRKSMSTQEKHTFGTVIRAVEHLCVARLEDTKEGHKALLMKVESHKFEIATNKSLIGQK